MNSRNIGSSVQNAEEYGIHVGSEQAGPKVAAAPNQTTRGRSIAVAARRANAPLELAT